MELTEVEQPEKGEPCEFKPDTACEGAPSGEFGEYAASINHREDDGGTRLISFCSRCGSMGKPYIGKIVRRPREPLKMMKASTETVVTEE